ncbi:MAG: hypothetical protein Q6361_04935 [Candidatus Hermodarchaeota archaeon]|nr:hypothetical protein [Candidatus Hermodarchaeota archaeon]
MVLRIFLNAWRISFRSSRRFIVYLVAYTILLAWIAIIVRTFFIQVLGSIDPISIANTTVVLGFTMVAGAIMGIVFSWLIAHGRRDDIATLKCVGWANSDIQQLVLGEVIFHTIAAVITIALLGVLVSGLYFATMVVISLDPLGNIVVPVPEYIRYLLIRPDFMLIAFRIVMFAQIPGILILIWRTLRISPMRALTRPE